MHFFEQPPQRCRNRDGDPGTSRFVSSQESLAKRLARLAVYSEVKNIFSEEDRRWGANDDRSVLILPGRKPKHEIALAKKLLNAKVVAVDVDPVAISAASAAGADETCLLNVEDIRLRGPYANIQPNAFFSFVNLDTCGLVTTTRPNIASALERATRLSNIIVTWFSYGHDDRQEIDYWAGDRARRFCDTDFAFAHVPITIRNRLLYLWDRAFELSPESSYAKRLSNPHLADLRILRVWAYRGNKMPMAVALWSNACLLKGQIPFQKISDTRYRDAVLEYAAKFSNQEAGELYGCTNAEIAAWKAVRTRKGVE